MKKNLLAVLLPVVAGVALSGTGFGLWIFKENVTEKSIGASMELQPAINIQDNMNVTLSVTNSVLADSEEHKKMIFDEDYKNGGFWEVTLSVSITYEQLAGELAKYDNGYQYSEPTYSDQGELSTKLGRYKISVANTISNTTTTVSKPLSSYIKLDDSTASPLSCNLKDFTSSEPVSGIVTLSHNYKFKFVPDTDYNNISSKTDYEKLKAAVSSGQITFTATFGNA